jgi:hypothetical protein
VAQLLDDAGVSAERLRTLDVDIFQREASIGPFRFRAADVNGIPIAASGTIHPARKAAAWSCRLHRSAQRAVLPVKCIRSACIVALQLPWRFGCPGASVAMSLQLP